VTTSEFLAEWNDGAERLLVHTSGSTGEPKPLWVEKRRMELSARVTCQFLGLKEGDTALLCMPLDYIAGKMMVVRAVACGLRLLSVHPSGHPLADLNSQCTVYSFAKSEVHTDHSPSLHIDFAAMVPMQVYNSLHVPEERERLRQIGQLIIGGGAISDALAAELHDFPNPVWSTYGMTETLSHIALRRLSGPEASDWYTPFEGVRLSLNEEQCLVIDAPAVHDGTLVTNDIAEISDKGFRILGRKDNVICSGGLKIQTEEVERMLHAHLREPYLITKRRDEKFGEIVVLLTEGDAAEAEAVCRRVLPPYWQPRAIVRVAQIPMTENGKPARKQAEALAQNPSR
jgi:O-succinylbenzoic acid--CoA ligase